MNQEVINAVAVLNAMKPGTTGSPVMRITFAIDYELVWGNWGDDADQDVSIWNPVCPPGFYALGHYAVGTYDKPETPMLLVQGLQEGVTAAPIDYNEVWGDYESGGDMDGCIWEPVPPPGFKALGLVATNSRNKPALDAVVCVQKDMVIQARVGERIWGDWGSGATQPCTLYKINPLAPPLDSKNTYITSGSFCGWASYDPLLSSQQAYALNVELPLDKKDAAPQLPVLSSRQRPAEETPRILENVTFLPCTMVKDPAYTDNLKGQVQDSAFYSLEKYAFYKLQQFDTSSSNKPRTVTFSATTGMSETEQESMTNTIGVSITAGYASSTNTGGPNFSVTLSYSLALTQSFSSTMFSQKTITKEDTIPADGAGALYTLSYVFILKRKDGSTLNSWLVDTASTHFADFPHFDA